jgi:8-amino-7-oxononanoate synthase
MTRFENWLAEAAAAGDHLGLTRRLRDSDRGTYLLDLSSNDYLGLGSGTLSVHTWLESALAEFTGFDSALVFSTGYHANLAVVQALTDHETLVVSDSHVHASMIDAVRLARPAQVRVVAHSDLEALRVALSGRTQPRAIVLIETIYSVFGDNAPVEELAAMCDTYEAVLVADEAHALGVAGPGGRGMLARHSLTKPHGHRSAAGGCRRRSCSTGRTAVACRPPLSRSGSPTPEPSTTVRPSTAPSRCGVPATSRTPSPRSRGSP